MPGLVKLRSPLRGPTVLSSRPAAHADGRTRRVYIETFGCQMNEADSDLILGQLARAGWTRVTKPEEADLVLVNTCAVREKAESRVYGRTSQLFSHRRENPDLVIGITGCMAEHLREHLEERAPHVTLVAGPDSYRRIAELAEIALAGERAVNVRLDRDETYAELDGEARADGITAFVPVQRGCDKFCTFCVVPFTRGRERSVAPRDVLRAVRSFARQGVREVTLLGQTVNSYRWEDVNFADLLHAVSEIEGIARIRFTSPHPRDFSDRLIEVLATNPKLCPYVHLPVQSGSDAMLEHMHRGHTRAQYLDLVRRLRAAIPDLALSTDLMVGFCGETEADHAETLSLLDEVRFAHAFMFAYSDREITHAAKKFDDDVPDVIKQRRLAEVIAVQDRHTRADHLSRVGMIEEVLVTGPGRRGDVLVGKTARSLNALMAVGSARPGELVRREVRASTGHSLDFR